MKNYIFKNIQRRHQTSTWINVDWSSVKYSDIHIRGISKENCQPSVTEIRLKMTNLKFNSNFPGANVLNDRLWHIRGRVIISSSDSYLSLTGYYFNSIISVNMNGVNTYFQWTCILPVIAFTAKLAKRKEYITHWQYLFNAGMDYQQKYPASNHFVFSRQFGYPSPFCHW